MRPSQALVGRYVRTNQGTGLVISCRRSGTLLVQLPGDRVREFSRQTVAVVDPPDPAPVPPARRCIHCLGPVTPGTAFPDVCGSCQELLADMEEDDAPPPAPTPPPAPRPQAPSPGRVFHPSDEDLAAYREMLGNRSFEPYRSGVKPSHTRSRWGVAMQNAGHYQK
jgi:hypothetical protein